MKKLFIFSLLTLLYLYTFTLSLSAVAKTTEEYHKEIEVLEEKITTLQTQAKTLANQIAYFDNQIALNELKILQTQDFIDSLTTKIGSLEVELTEKFEILADQIWYTYISSNQDYIKVLLSSPNFSRALKNFHYQQLLQEQNRTFLHDTQVAQTTYQDQKELLVETQKRLHTQKTSLAGLRAERDNLLKSTKNSEATYQKQLLQAQAELSALESAIAAAVRVGPIKAGEPVGLVGNSGYPSCSTGKHLHFEVRKDDNWVNAETYLRSITDKYGLRIGSGNWNWPIKEPIIITQRYGKTSYSYVYAYSGGIHTGIDMLSNTSDIIYAPSDGTLYASTSKCGSSTLKLKYIDHGSGLKTFYLHVQ